MPTIQQLEKEGKEKIDVQVKIPTFDSCLKRRGVCTRVHHHAQEAKFRASQSSRVRGPIAKRNAYIPGEGHTTRALHRIDQGAGEGGPSGRSLPHYPRCL